jgi:hypothetical protein
MVVRCNNWCEVRRQQASKQIRHIRIKYITLVLAHILLAEVVVKVIVVVVVVVRRRRYVEASALLSTSI